MSAGVRLGIVVGVGVAVHGVTVGTVGRAVKVRVGLGVGPATVGETWDKAGAVGLTQQPVKALEMMTSNKYKANSRIPGLTPDRCKTCPSCSFDGRDGISVILSS